MPARPVKKFLIDDVPSSECPVNFCDVVLEIALVLIVGYTARSASA